MNPASILNALVLLAVANSAPVIATRLMGGVAAWPLDFNRTFSDAQPILGPAKTIRGIVASIGATAAAAPLLDLDWSSGALIAMASMAGDIFSSFVKRRLRLPASSRATGLDQIPEALLGALAAQSALLLTLFDVLLTILAFFLGQVVFSRLSYEIGLRKEPY